jgi:rhodanese-related sulfurtransferase
MPSIERIGPEEAKRKMDAEGYVYLDVRTEAEFAAGHPAGAFNAPVSLAGASGMVPNGDFVRVVAQCFAKDAKIVVGCKGGVRSLRAAEMLLAAGFTNVLDQRAGWEGVASPFGEITEKGWSRVSLPREEGAPAGHAYADLVKRAGA